MQFSHILHSGARGYFVSSLLFPRVRMFYMTMTFSYVLENVSLYYTVDGKFYMLTVACLY